MATNKRKPSSHFSMYRASSMSSVFSLSIVTKGREVMSSRSRSLSRKGYSESESGGATGRSKVRKLTTQGVAGSPLLVISSKISARKEPSFKACLVRWHWIQSPSCSFTLLSLRWSSQIKVCLIVGLSGTTFILPLTKATRPTKCSFKAASTKDSGAAWQRLPLSPLAFLSPPWAAPFLAGRSSSSVMIAITRSPLSTFFIACGGMK